MCGFAAFALDAHATRELACDAGTALSMEPGSVAQVIMLPMSPPTRVLIVEERGIDVVVEALAGDASRLTSDIAPSGWSLTPIVLRADVDRVRVLPPRYGQTGNVRLNLYCGLPEDGDLVALQAMTDASDAAAQSDRADLPTPQREAARARALGLLERAGIARASSGQWPWLRAQSLHVRGYLHSRQGQAARSRAAYLDAAQAWQGIGEAPRALIARHRAAQQALRQGDWKSSARMLREVLADAGLANNASLKSAALNDLCLALRSGPRLQEALACFDDAIAYQGSQGNVLEHAMSLANRADAAMQLGRVAQARTDATQAAALARNVKAARPSAIARLVLGNVDRAHARLEPAIRHYLAALDDARTTGDAAWIANAESHLGVAHLLLGDANTAVQFLQRAAERYESGGQWSNAALALRNLAEANDALGDHQAALVGIERAVDLVTRHTADDAVVEVFLSMARLQLKQGRTAAGETAIAHAATHLGDAPVLRNRQRLALLRIRSATVGGRWSEVRRLVQEARALTGATGDPLFEAQLLIEDSRALEAQDRHLEAESKYLAVVASMTEVAEQLSYPLYRAYFLAGARDALEGAVRASLARTGEEGVVSRLQWFLDLRTKAWAADTAGRAPGPRTAVADRPQSGHDEALRVYWGLAAQSSALDSAQSLSEQSARSRLSVPAAHPDEARRWSVPEIRKSLADDEALLVVFLGATTAMSWQVDRERVVEHRAAAEPLGALIAGLRADLSRPAADSVTLEQRMVMLHGMLFGEVPRVESRHWYVVADQEVTSIPALLAIAPRLLNARTADSDWPTVTNLVSTVAPKRTPRGCCAAATLTAFGDPVANAVQAADLPSRAPTRLPGARREVRTLAALWPEGRSRPYVGDEFTASRVVDALETRNSIVHFATHGLVDPRSPGLGGLLVADDSGERLELLSEHDITAIPVAADLVVLSVCDAGGGASLPITGTHGPTRWLLQAGAGQVISPLWAVDDAASSAQMRAFYAHLGEGASPRAALVHAQRVARLNRSSEGPFAWAGLTLSE